MAIFIYFAGAFMLLRCCFSGSYRARTRERWKKTPQHRVIFEVGTGIIGLVVIGAIITVIVVSSQK
ncbi:MAG TPA: hypothetical protein VFF11_09095 [Candidatus Binatia bacterium]|nr:hypothetical protein [Candidatus Binatia bacterium]